MVAVDEAVLPHIAEQVGGVDKVVQVVVVLAVNLVLVAYPAHMALVDKHDVLADTHYRIHVVRVDDGGDVELVRDVAQQFVNHYRGLRVKA